MDYNKLAELCAVIAGDGHLSIYKSKRRTDYKITIDGDFEEIDYYHYLSTLFVELFNKKPQIYRMKALRLAVNSKKLIYYFKSLGIPSGKKSYIIRFPEWIKKDLKLSCHFLRGLADTDFSLMFKKGSRKQHNYPKIMGIFVSKALIEDIKDILDKLNISYGSYSRIARNPKFRDSPQQTIEISGVKNLNKWMENIGFSNPRHLTKLEIWERLGYCPPYTTLSQRKEILKKNIPATRVEFTKSC